MLSASRRSLFVLSLTIPIIFLSFCGRAPTEPSPVRPTPTRSTNLATATPGRTPLPSPTRNPTSTTTPSPDPSQQEILLDGIQTFGRGIIQEVERSPDGERIFSIEENILRWYSGDTFELLGELDVGYVEFPEIQISPYSEIVVIESGLYGVDIYDLATGALIADVLGGFGGLSGIVFTPDNNGIFYTSLDRTTGGAYNSIQYFSFSNPDEEREFPVLFPFRYHLMSDPALSPNAKLIAAGYRDTTNKLLYIYDAATGAVLHAIEQPAQIWHLDFSPDGDLLAAGGEDGLVKLWDPDSGQLLRTIAMFTDDISSLEFSEDGTSLFVSAGSGPIQRLDLVRHTLVDVDAADPDEPFLKTLHLKGFLSGALYDGNRVLFSPDGGRLAIAGSNILIWDIASGNLMQSLEKETPELIRGMVFNLDGSKLAAVDDAGRITVWDLTAGETSGNVQGIPGVEFGSGVVADQGIAFSPEDSFLAFGNGPGVEIWNLETGTIEVSFSTNEPEAVITSIDFSEDGRLIYAVVNGNQAIRIWAVESGELVREPALTAVAQEAELETAQHHHLFARNNSQGDRYWIELWNLDTEDFFELEVSKRLTAPILFSPNGELLLALSGGQLFVWRTSDGLPLYIGSFNTGLNDLAVSPDGRLLAAGYEGVARVMDFSAIHAFIENPPQIPTSTQQISPATPTRLPTLNPVSTAPNDGDGLGSEDAGEIEILGVLTAGRIDDIQWIYNGQQIVTAGSRGVSEYSGGSLEELQRFDPGVAFDSVVYLNDGRILAAGDRSGTVEIWELTENILVSTFAADGPAVLSPDGSLVSAVNEDHALDVWNVETGVPETHLHGYVAESVKPVFSADSRLLAAALWDRSIRVWDAASGVIVNALGGSEGDYTDLSFSLDGSLLIGAGGGSAWIWPAQASLGQQEISFYPGTVDGNLTVFKETVTAAAITVDNQFLAIGTSQREIWLRNRITGQLVAGLSGHTAPIERLVFSPEGSLLLSLDADGSWMVWDVAEERPIAVNSDHFGPVRGLEALSTGQVGAFGSNTYLSFDPGSGAIVNRTGIYTGTIFAASPTGDLLAVYNPPHMELWDAASGDLIFEFTEEPEETLIDYQFENWISRHFYEADFSAEGDLLAVGGLGGAWFYDVGTRELNAHPTYFYNKRLTLSPDGQVYLLCESELYGCRVVLQAANSTHFQVNELSPPQIWAVDFEFDPRQTMVGIVGVNDDTRGDQFVVWDLTGTSPPRTLDLPAEPRVLTLAFSPNGRLAVLGFQDGTIALIDLARFEVAGTLNGHRGPVTELEFSSDGSYLISAGEDGLIIVYGLP